MGDQVELHPATDAWMRGDRYGTVTGVGRFRPYIDADGTASFAGQVFVLLDKSGRIRRFHPDNVFVIDPVPAPVPLTTAAYSA